MEDAGRKDYLFFISPSGRNEKKLCVLCALSEAGGESLAQLLVIDNVVAGIPMKQSPFEKELIKNLGPSKFSGEGFLGTDTRPVDEIIETDARVLDQRCVTKGAVVEALRRAYEKAREAFGGEVVIRSGVTAVFHESMGRIPSPFPGDGVFEKGEAVVKDARHGHKLIVTRLGIHLIAKHGFFQGKGSRYRMDPETLIQAFDLRPQDS